MAADSDQIEGLKMIVDWCKWLITIETGAIGLVGIGLKDTATTPILAPVVKYCASASIACFVGSIVVAMLMISAIPASFREINPGQDIWDRGVYAFLPRLVCIGNIRTYAHLLGLSFVLGIVAFAATVLQRLNIF
jgi:hypothetical protein